MTARMLTGIKGILQKEMPDALLVYGDTKSLGSHEETNGKLTDHCSALLFCVAKDSLEKLRQEGLGERSYCVGNIMYDSFLHFVNQPWKRKKLVQLDGGILIFPNSIIT